MSNEDARLAARAARAEAAANLGTGATIGEILSEAVRLRGLASTDDRHGELDEGFDARYERRRRRILVRPALTIEGRTSAIAHELGHHDLHPDPRLDGRAIRYATADGLRWDCGYSRRSLVEAQADAYAAEFLCPAASVASMLGGSDPSPTALSKRLGLERRLVLDQAARTLLPSGVDGAADRTDAPSLSGEQEDAAEPDGHLLVEGAAGSGKTTVLEAVALRLACSGSAAIAIVAASDHAARTFQHRMASSAPSATPMMWIGTGRSLAGEIVARHAVRLGLTEDFRILDRIAVRDDRGDEDPAARIAADEIMAAASRILEENADVTALLGRRFRRVIVDDCQEADAATTRILRALAGAGALITAAGDLDHPARRHDGADPDAFRRLMEGLGAARRRLTVNRRNPPEIASACADFRFGGAAAVVTGAAVRRSRVDSADALAASVGEHAYRLAAQGVALRDQAILARTHAELKLIGGALARAGIPTLHFGEHVERVEVGDLLAVARLFEPSDGRRDLARVARLPAYLCPEADARRIEGFAHRRGIPVRAALLGIERAKALSDEGLRAMALLREHLGGEGHATLYEHLVEWIFSSRYFETPRHGTAPAALARLGAYHALAVARGMEAVDEGGARRLEARLKRIGSLELTREFARLGADACAQDAVAMMTMHASQGRTFECAHVVLPSGLAGRRRVAPAHDDEAVAVALSRARRHLHVLEYVGAHHRRPTRQDRKRQGARK